MTELLELNLLDLRNRFLLSTKAKIAGEVLQKARLGRNEVNLRKLLRHHSEKSVHDKTEIKQRDAFDMLLAFYGLVEIASMIGYVPNPLPLAFRNVALFDVSQEAVLKYYSVHYPLLLPDLFRRRLESEIDIREAPQNGSGQLETIFFGFLGLEERFRRDPELELLLRLLDSFYFGKYDISDVVDTVRHPKELVRRISKKPSKRNTLDDALQGFVKLLTFCHELDSLLNAATAYPIFQSAMWNYHSYWFKIIRKEFAKNMRGGVLAFSKWNLPEESDRNQEEINQYVRSTVKVIDRLTSNHYDHLITRASSIQNLANPYTIF